MWAARTVSQLERAEKLPTSIPITTHGIRLGRGVRLIGLEGEPVAALGFLIDSFYGGGVTFPLGYTDGCQLYLPTSKMLAERGYEVDSYYEYGFPAPLAPGTEQNVLAGLNRLRAAGIR